MNPPTEQFPNTCSLAFEEPASKHMSQNISETSPCEQGSRSAWDAPSQDVNASPLSQHASERLPRAVPSWRLSWHKVQEAVHRHLFDCNTHYGSCLTHTDSLFHKRGQRHSSPRVTTIITENNNPNNENVSFSSNRQKECHLQKNNPLSIR